METIMDKIDSGIYSDAIGIIRRLEEKHGIKSADSVLKAKRKRERRFNSPANRPKVDLEVCNFVKCKA